MRTVTFFETREELRELTGLSGDNSDEALWVAGFCLDDWDFGFVSETEWKEEYDTEPYYAYWLLQQMGFWSEGYKHVEYGGKHYYLLYHS